MQPDIQGLLLAALYENGIPTPAEQLSERGFLRWGKNSRYSAKCLGNDGVYIHDFVDDLTICRFFDHCASSSPEEIAAREKQRQAIKAKLEAEREAKYIEAAEDAEYAWSEAEKSGDSEYLSSKAVSAHGIRYGHKRIIVPIRDVQGKLYSFQTIYDKGAAPLYLNGSNKEFLKDGKVKGCFHVIGSLEDAEEVIVCEGYATGATLHEALGKPIVVAFNAGNLEAVVVSLLSEYAFNIVIAADNDQWKERNTGLEKANDVAKKYGCIVVFPDFIPAYSQQKPTDWNDLLCLCGAGAVKQQFEKKLLLANRENCIQRLASLSNMDYDMVKKEEAKKLGVSVGSLNEEVKKHRVPSPTQNGIQFPEYQSWHNQFGLADLLDEIASLFRKYAVLPEHADTAIALWVVFTWLIDCAEVAAILAIVSPEKGCGKTTVLSILDRLVYKPLSASNITPASTFRIIEMHQPTLIIDEGDTFIKNSDDLRGILNSGHTRPTAYVMRSVGDDHEPKRFNTWGVKAIALIGRLPETLHDRSLVIPLRKKLPHEKIERFRNVPTEPFEIIQRKLFRLHNEMKGKKLVANWGLPDFLSDRACDNWEPLLVIAKMASKEWYKKALGAALAISNKGNNIQGIGVELLQDIRTIFERENRELIFTQDLLSKLCTDRELRWCIHNRNNPITPKQIAHYLAQFDIKPGTKREGPQTLKGYYRKDFEDAFSRYLDTTGDLSVTTSQQQIEIELARAYAGSDAVTAKEDAYTNKARQHFHGIQIKPPPKNE